jgi:hypothetical protein
MGVIIERKYYKSMDSLIQQVEENREEEKEEDEVEGVPVCGANLVSHVIRRPDENMT